MSQTLPPRMAPAEVLPLLLAGMLCGVSLLAQPAKFAAQDVPLAQLVTAGAAIFHVSHVTQFVALMPLTWFSPSGKLNRPAAWACLAVFAAALMLQHVWLLPALNEKLAALRAHQPRLPSPHHGIYVALELLKISALLALAWLRPVAGRSFNLVRIVRR